jgi:hypothetical protein
VNTVLVAIPYIDHLISNINGRFQCSPQTKLKAYWKGIVWVHIKGFGPTSKKTEHRRDMGAISLKYAGENTGFSDTAVMLLVSSSVFDPALLPTNEASLSEYGNK